MIDHELNELKREFLDEALEKVAEIQTASEGKRSDETFERIAYLAHQLKGSGGSYGYQKISSDAATIEKEAEAASGGPVQDGIRQHVLSLKAEIELRRKELE